LLTASRSIPTTFSQASYLARAAGTARFAYNWALAEWKRQYEAWKADDTQPKPSQAALRRQLNAIKREQFPWMMEVTKNAPQMAIIQLGHAVHETLGVACKPDAGISDRMLDRICGKDRTFTVQ